MEYYTHEIFPTLVLETLYPDAQNFKDIFFIRVWDYVKEKGISFEETHNCLHHEKLFKDLYKFATKSAQEYLNQVKVDHNLFDFNLIKSWLNIIKAKGNIVHAHYESHLSFVYYVSIPDGMNIPIRFELKQHQKFIPWHHLYDRATERNAVNSYHCDFEPVEGKLLVFPSSIYHGAIDLGGDHKGEISNTLDELKQKRISIAGDFILTYRDTDLHPVGIQPIVNWRRFY
jgi:uncharacterized protein (TIGR02466 family)